MKLSWFGRLALALFASLALGLGMSACGGGTIAYLWVLGQQYNQISAFKVDDYTGNLTQAPHQPFPSGGSNPVMLLVKTGGRFLYVLNQGSGDTPTSNSGDANITLFSVGGDGSLTPLQTYVDIQGFMPEYIQFDGTNSFLYVLSKYSPAYQPDSTKPNYDVNGSITVFSINPVDGRLTLVTNTQITSPTGANPTYWEVGQDPFMMKALGGCLYTVNSADHSITPYTQGGAGQLVNVTTGKITTNAATISSINGGGSYIILTDPTNNNIIPYQIGTNCSLDVLSGGIQPNASGTTNPVNSMISTSGNYLYILNYSTTNTQQNTPGSSITGFLISNGNLSPLTQYGSPWSVGSGPVCMVEDPTNKYMYISDYYSGSVTGKVYDNNTGSLRALPRGSDFAASGLSSCLAISGAVD